MLILADLTTWLQDIYRLDYLPLFSLAGGLTSNADAANAWANAYSRYAATATAAGATVIPAGLAPAEQQLANKLTTYFSSTAIPLNTLTTQIATAIGTFWLGDPTGTPPTTPQAFSVGLVTSTPGIGVLANALEAYWTAPYESDNNVNAATTAGYLHTFTLTVIVTTGGGPVTLV